MARDITYLTDVFLITCVVESGLADKIIDAATSVGAQGATINYARGTGIRAVSYTHLTLPTSSWV